MINPLSQKKYNGQLSRKDIDREIKAKNLIITPLESTKIKAASFDISPSCLVMSVRSGSFMRIHSNISRCEKGYRNPERHCAACKKKANAPASCPEQKFVYISPRDTALVLSKEYIQIPSTMCGSVVSRVSTVSNGLGHISTTIDPLWKGALLIAISNPSSEPKKLMIQDESSAIPLATVTLQYLNTPVKKESINTTHLPARVDILEKYLYSVSETKSRWSVVKKFFNNILFIKDYNLTVRIIDSLKSMTTTTPEEWPEKLHALENEICGQKIRGSIWQNNILKLRKFFGIVLLMFIVCTLALVLIQASISDNQHINDYVPSLIFILVECLIALILKL